MSTRTAAFAFLAAALLDGSCARKPPSGFNGPRHWTPAALASPDYETTPTFHPDGRTMVFFRGDPGFSTYKLFQTHCADGAWAVPTPVPFAAPPPAIEADPGFSPDGRRLYYISTRHAPGSDDFDIWYVDRDGGRWGTPQRLPEPVNSPQPELLPRVDGGGRLYFGSSRPGGHGKGDIYVAEQRNGRWFVANVGPPVSTPAFEYEAEISLDGRTMIVVADRGDRSHLYRFEHDGAAWVQRERIAARGDVFQVGPLLSPRAGRLLFAQAHGKSSGEMFLVNLARDADEAWPPDCRKI